MTGEAVRSRWCCPPTRTYFGRMRSETCTATYWRNVFAEFLATFLLVAAQCALPANWDPSRNSGDVLQTGIGMAFVVIAIGWALGDFGGAHMNPAVTLAFVIRAEITFVTGIIYWAVQCAGGICAAYFIYAVTPADVRQASLLAATNLGKGMEWWQGMMVEAWITMALVLTVLGSTYRLRKPHPVIATLPIGVALGLGIFVAFSSTGGSMNPARSLGPAVVAGITMGHPEVWTYHYIYWVGPFIGAILAAIIYSVLDSADRQMLEGDESWDDWDDDYTRDNDNDDYRDRGPYREEPNIGSRTTPSFGGKASSGYVDKGTFNASGASALYGGAMNNKGMYY